MCERVLFCFWGIWGDFFGGEGIVKNVVWAPIAFFVPVISKKPVPASVHSEHTHTRRLRCAPCRSLLTS